MKYIHHQEYHQRNFYLNAADLFVFAVGLFLKKTKMIRINGSCDFSIYNNYKN